MFTEPCSKLQRIEFFPYQYVTNEDEEQIFPFLFLGSHKKVMVWMGGILLIKSCLSFIGFMSFILVAFKLEKEKWYMESYKNFN